MECDDETEIFSVANICELGGGFISLGANTIDLSTICTTPNAECEIGATYKDKTIENRNPIEVSQIKLTTTIATFTNHSTITSNQDQIFFLENGNSDSTGKISHFINHGNISGGIRIMGEADMEITNYGLMHGVWTMYKPLTITINNFGIIETAQGGYVTTGTGAVHFAFENKDTKLAIQNYLINIRETQSDFNNFKSYHDKTNNKNSHLIILYNGHKPTATNVYFKDSDSKIILDFSDEFELGKGYLISKLVVDRSGDGIEALGVDFSRLALSDERKDIYELVSSDDSFIIRLMNKITETPITAIYKANIRTMNNFMTISNSMIYPRKYNSVILRERSERRISKNISSLRDLPTANRGNPHIKKSLDSANHLKSYESFSYRNESQTRRIQRHNKRNYSRNLNNSSLRASVSERGNLAQNLNNSAESKPYYFILTPFINHNYFFESGRYNLSGFDYGFLTAFSARVAESNTLGTHFMMSYGTLGDSSDKNFRISNLNLNLGLNYKLDLIYDMYFKARGDMFYFLNQVKTLTMIEAIKPNNLGFGLSVSYGKDFDFKQGGILGIEGGLDYKALSASEIMLDSMNGTYKKSLYNVLYVDLEISYAKYFGNFGFNANLGIKGNITANQLAKSQIRLNAFNRSVDMVLDNDKVLGYANVGLSYVLNHRNFDMEFSIAYYGNFGDRIISNGGGFEWRVGW